MDVLVQRYLPGVANEAHRASGAWEDLRTITVEDGSTAAETRDAVRDAVREYLVTLEPLRAPADRIRVSDLSRVREFDSTRSAPNLAEGSPAVRGDGV
jgi:hypothetical protein